jgi:hypothetical protein
MFGLLYYIILLRLQNVSNIQQATECLAYYKLSKTMEEECPICYNASKYVGRFLGRWPFDVCDETTF